MKSAVHGIKSAQAEAMLWQHCVYLMTFAKHKFAKHKIEELLKK
jgi:hypothetical protein